MNVCYVVNARLPNKKAYGIQIAKMCEAFIEAGVDLTLVIPRTRASKVASLKDFYQLRVDVPTTILPGLDWYDRGYVGLLLSSLVFITSSTLYLLRKNMRGNPDVIYTIDMDTFSYFFLPLFGVRCFAEMHGAKRSTVLNRFFFKRVAGVIATNTEIRKALTRTFALPPARATVEPNGFDAHEFAARMSREEAGEKLSLKSGRPMALYVGRFYAWKGLDILAKACAQMPEIDCYVVGGSAEQFREVTGVSHVPDNLHIVGECKSKDVPHWLLAADVLLILGTKKNEQSFRYTAPMKVYEYMASERPIVASGTPALRSIIGDGEALFYEPDNAGDLAAQVRAVVGRSRDTGAMIVSAARAAREHSWQKRAARILSHMERI